MFAAIEQVVSDIVCFIIGHIWADGLESTGHRDWCVRCLRTDLGNFWWEERK